MATNNSNTVHIYCQIWVYKIFIYHFYTLRFTQGHSGGTIVLVFWQYELYIVAYYNKKEW